MVHKQYTCHFRYLTSRGLLEAAAQRVFGGDGLILGGLVAILAGVHYVVAVVLDLLAALCVVVAVAVGRGGRAQLRAFLLMTVTVVIVQLRHLVHLDRGLRRVFYVDVNKVGAVRCRHMGHEAIQTRQFRRSQASLRLYTDRKCVCVLR